MNRLLFILGICFLLPNTGKAWQHNDWMSIFNRVQVNDVLEKNQSIWIASDAGLFKVDKSTMAVTHYNKKNSALPDFHIQTLTEDLAGNLWIGTYDLAMAMVPSNGGAWTVVNYPATQNTLRVYCSEVDPSGHVWLGTNQGLLEYDGNNWQAHPVSGNINSGTGPIWEMAINSQGKIYAASHLLLSYENGVWTDLSDTSIHLSYSSAYVCLENDSTVWYMNDMREAYRLSGQNLMKWHRHNGSQTPKLPISSNTARMNMQIDANGHVYYNNTDGELAYYDGVQWQTEQTLQTALNGTTLMDAFLTDNGTFWGFADGQVIKSGTTVQTNSFLETYDFYLNHFYNDNNGNLFLVDYNDGAYQVDNFAWTNFQSTITGATGYSELEFDAQNEKWWVARISNEPVILEQQGSNWVLHDATSTGGLFYTYNHANKAVYFLGMEVNNAGVVLVRDNFDRILKYENGTWSLLTQLSSTYHLSDFTADANGNFWWVENQSGGGSTLKKYDGTSISSQSISSNSIMLLQPVFDDQGNLWMAGEVGSGSLYKYDGNSFVNIVFDTNGANAQRILFHNGTVYIATAYDGLYLYDGTQWTHKTTVNSGMSSNEIRRMALAANGDLWLGTSGSQIIDIWQRSNISSATEEFSQTEVEVQLFPNPAKKQVRLEVEASTVSALALYNAQGQLLRELPIKNTQDIDVSDLAAGLYFIQIQTPGKIQLHKLIKE